MRLVNVYIYYDIDSYVKTKIMPNSNKKNKIVHKIDKYYEPT